MLRNKPANEIMGYQAKKENEQNKNDKLYLLWWKWATMPKLVEAPLLDGGAMAQWRWRRGSVGGSRGNGVSRHP